MPIAPKLQEPIIPIVSNEVPAQLTGDSLKYYRIMYSVFGKLKWFPHTEIFRHVRRAYQNTESVICLIDQWVSAKVAEKQEQTGLKTKRVSCCFIVEPEPDKITISNCNLEDFTASFEETENGNKQSRYFPGYRIVINKFRKKKSWIINLWHGKKSGYPIICNEPFEDDQAAIENVYGTLIKLLS